jgi:hypothetical protein
LLKTFVQRLRQFCGHLGLRGLVTDSASRGRRRAAAPRAREVRLQIEGLEDRLVPSGMVTSAITTTHNYGYGPVKVHDLYAIDAGTGRVVDFRTIDGGSGSSRTALGGPQTTIVRASIDPATGAAEVFAVQDSAAGPVGALWLYDAHNTWHNFGGSYAVWHDDDLSATRDGQVYAVTSDDSDIKLVDSSGHVTDLGNPNPGSSIRGVAAGVGWYGQDQVFAIAGGALYVNSANAPGYWRLVDNGASFTTLSATQHDQVFAVDSNGKLHLETEYGVYYSWYSYHYWSGQDISAPGKTYEQVSADTDASGGDEVYAIASDNTLYRYDQGNWAYRDSSAVEVAGADGGYFFDLNNWGSSDNYVYAYNPSASYPWIYLGDNVYN